MNKTRLILMNFTFILYKYNLKLPTFKIFQLRFEKDTQFLLKPSQLV